MGNTVANSTLANTASDLDRLPDTPDIVVKINMQRIRNNENLKGVWEVIEKRFWNPDYWGFDTIIMGAYNVGKYEAETLTLLRGSNSIQNGEKLEKNLWALGPKTLIDQSKSADSAGKLRPKKNWNQLLSLAPPKNANNSIVSLGASLSLDARIQLSSFLGMATIPPVFSLWVDAIDDLAAIAILECEDETEAKLIQRNLIQQRKKLQKNKFVKHLMLAPALENLKIIRRGKRVKMVFLLGPTYFQMVTKGLIGSLSSS